MSINGEITRVSSGPKTRFRENETALMDEEDSDAIEHFETKTAEKSNEIATPASNSQQKKESAFYLKGKTMLKVLKELGRTWSLADATIGISYLSRKKQAIDLKPFIEENLQTKKDLESDEKLQNILRYTSILEHVDRKLLKAFLETTKLDEDKLIAYEINATAERTGYLIYIDAKTKSVLLVLRGTHSATDVLTDLSCYSVAFLDGYAHKGMSLCAKWFEANVTGLLQEQIEANPGYKLTIIGHSLGGSTAMLLTMLLKDRFPGIHCFAFGAAPVVNLELAERYDDCITMFVYKDDIVPRASTVSIEELRKEVSSHPWREEFKEDLMQSELLQKAATYVSAGKKFLQDRGWFKSTTTTTTTTTSTVAAKKNSDGELELESTVTEIVEEETTEQLAEKASASQTTHVAGTQSIRTTTSTTKTETIISPPLTELQEQAPDASVASTNVYGGQTPPSPKEFNDIRLYLPGTIYYMRRNPDNDNRVFAKKATRFEFEEIVLSSSCINDHLMANYLSAFNDWVYQDIELQSVVTEEVQIIESHVDNAASQQTEAKDGQAALAKPYTESPTAPATTVVTPSTMPSSPSPSTPTPLTPTPTSPIPTTEPKPLNNNDSKLKPTKVSPKFEVNKPKQPSPDEIDHPLAITPIEPNVESGEASTLSISNGNAAASSSSSSPSTPTLVPKATRTPPPPPVAPLPRPKDTATSLPAHPVPPVAKTTRTPPPPPIAQSEAKQMPLPSLPPENMTTTTTTTATTVTTMTTITSTATVAASATTETTRTPSTPTTRTPPPPLISKTTSTPPATFSGPSPTTTATQKPVVTPQRTTTVMENTTTSASSSSSPRVPPPKHTTTTTTTTTKSPPAATTTTTTAATAPKPPIIMDDQEFDPWAAAKPKPPTKQRATHSGSSTSTNNSNSSSSGTITNRELTKQFFAKISPAAPKNKAPANNPPKKSYDITTFLDD